MDNYIPDDTIKLTLSNDYAFKRIFSNEENKDILSSLLSVILKIPVKDIQDLQIENTLIGNTYIYEKTGILDIKLTLSSGEKINVEMQKSWQADYINRVLFYWANRYKENFQKGARYSSLTKTIVITILNEKFPCEDKVHSIYRLTELETKKELTDIQEIHFLDLTKVDANNLDELNEWLLFIKTDSEEERKMLAERNEMLEKTNDKLNLFWSNKQERYAYEQNLMKESDIESRLHDSYALGQQVGEQRGIQIGEQRGIQMGSISTARNLLNMNIDIDTIIKATNLDRSIIIDLQNGKL